MKGIRKLRDLSQGYRAIIFLRTAADLTYTSLWQAISEYCGQFHHYPDELFVGKANTYKSSYSPYCDWGGLKIVEKESFDEDEWAVGGPLGVVYVEGA